jgi:hypothetical protein
MIPHSPSRRAFLASVTAASAAALAPAAEVGKKRKYRFIDIHTHIGTFYWG